MTNVDNSKIDLNNNAFKLLLLLAFVDLVFILIHVLFKMSILQDERFSIAQDLGYAEIFQFIKEIWIVALLLLVALARKHAIYLAWALLFTYLLIDDSLRVHEDLGNHFVDWFGLQPAFQLRAKDLGELGVSLVAGGIFFVLIGASYLKSEASARRVSNHLFLLIAALAFFGVVIDLFHSAVTWQVGVWGLIEDGGEMLIMSVIVWYVYNLKTTPNPAISHSLV